MRRSTLAFLLLAAVVLPAGAASAAGSAHGAARGTLRSSSTTARTAGSAVQASLGDVNHVGDFNGDGWPDLAAGAPEDDIRSHTDAGSVNVLYGSKSGPRLKGNQFWTQDSTGVGRSNNGDLFGRSAIAGDFNNDGYDDLAIAAIRKKVDGVVHAGAVYVLYGSATGLIKTGAQFFTADTPGMPGYGAQNSALFGGALYAADWNHDGYADLAIGEWCATVQGQMCSGLLIILPGSATGVTVTGAQEFDRSTPGMVGTPPAINDQFGRQVTSADFNKDGNLDIAIGCRLQTVNGKAEAGAVQILYGTATGLSITGNQMFTEDSPGMAGNGATVGDWFGRPVTQADFNNDGYDDLVVGARYETVQSLAGAGAVFVLYGGPSGLTTTGSQEFDEGTAGLAGQGLSADANFGHQAGAGDFNHDGYDDVAINAIDETVNGQNQAGTVTLMYGGPSGLSVNGSVFWYEGIDGIPGTPTKFGWFGFYLWSKDFNQDGYADLAMSAPGDTVQGVTTAGSVMIVFGGPTGLTTTNLKQFDQSVLRGNGPGQNDHFGGILA